MLFLSHMNVWCHFLPLSVSPVTGFLFSPSWNLDNSVVTCRKLKLIGGTWVGLAHNIISHHQSPPGSVTERLQPRRKESGGLLPQNLSLPKVNMSFIVPRQVFISLIATLLSLTFAVGWQGLTAWLAVTVHVLLSWVQIIWLLLVY